ncbi:unnamed protein product [Camellia sinensis]
MVSQEADTYGDMDEELEDFVGDYFQDVSEVDFDYEFDAARFFDFTRLESYSEAQDAERWFQSAGTYPPSQNTAAKNENASRKSNDGESMTSSSNNLDHDMDPEVFELDDNEKGPKSRNGMAEDIPKAKIKSVAKSSKIRSSTLMQPTASHLAKLSRGREVHSIRFLERSQKPLTKLDERSLKNPLGVDRDATKRQKLENGYLCKVAHLKHQSLLLHKLPKVRQVDPNTVNSRLKVTVPREPDLETAHRAQKHRYTRMMFGSSIMSLGRELADISKINGMEHAVCLNSGQGIIQNQKNSQGSFIASSNKEQTTISSEFHLKTSKRAMQHSSANNNSESIPKNEATRTERICRPPFLRLNCEEASKKEKCKTLNRVKYHPHNKKIISSKKDVCTFQNVKEEAKELKLLNDDGLSYNPPIELFNKLSLKSELEHNAISPSKPPLHTEGSKENIPDVWEEAEPMWEQVDDPRNWTPAEHLQEEEHEHPLRARGVSPMAGIQ